MASTPACQGLASALLILLGSFLVQHASATAPSAPRRALRSNAGDHHFVRHQPEHATCATTAPCPAGNSVYYYCTAPSMSVDATGSCRPWDDGPFSSADCGAQCVSGMSEPASVYEPVNGDYDACDKAAAAFSSLPFGGKYPCGEGAHFLCLVPGRYADASGGCRARSDGPFSSADCDEQCILTYEEYELNDEEYEPTYKGEPAISDKHKPASESPLVPEPIGGALLCEKAFNEMVAERPLFIYADYKFCGEGVHFLCLAPGMTGDARGSCRAWDEGPFPLTDCSAHCVYTSEQLL
ncbi:hypothetical protein FOA52_003553 [Chlamydomonas sp. UWO 241]|nr:hypothetical protein FOA52_003553 [Chlamydomonas sp. UWO 241]